MRATFIFFILTAVPFFSIPHLAAQDSLLHIIIVAGQSNALNWHADAQLLESSPVDRDIPFYYHTGLPPDRGYEVPFNATSDSLWTTLSSQTQQPFVRYFEHFFGPEITLARELSAHIPNLAVFKSAYGGSNLASDWKKGAGTGNQLYDHMLGQYNHATALLDSGSIQYEVAGFFWIQGESDAASVDYATAYEINLKNLIQNIRADVGNPALNVVLARIGTHLPPPYIYKETVRTAQMTVAEDDPLVSWVDTDDLPKDTDSIHLLADGVKTAGQRMAAAWLHQVATGITESGEGANHDFLLHNYPNPFNPATTIRFTLSKPEYVTITIYDLLGRELEILTQSKYSSGVHSVVFNAHQYATGIYLYEAQIGNVRMHKLMSLVK
jgi:hypothetical protein